MNKAIKFAAYTCAGVAAASLAVTASVFVYELHGIIKRDAEAGRKEREHASSEN